MSEPQPWSPIPKTKPWRTEFAQAESAQPLIQPLVVGWGWGDGPFIIGSDFLDYNQWWGTNDLAAHLAVPAAIEYQETNIWPAVCQRCRELAQRTGRLSNS